MDEDAELCIRQATMILTAVKSLVSGENKNEQAQP
jgi:hypothetical protein